MIHIDAGYYIPTLPFGGGVELVPQQMTIRVGGQAIVLNHNPFLCYGGSCRDVWQLFGHVHSG